MTLLIVAVLLVWVLGSVPIALVCGRAFAAGSRTPEAPKRASEFELVA
jgi:hypothetical protein